MAHKVNIYDYEGIIIGRVNYNNNLDFWNGSNFQNGGTGLHLGLTRLRKSGKYVLIHGPDWQGSRDRAEIISKKRAVQEILNSGNTELFEKYPELKELYEKQIETEED